MMDLCDIWLETALKMQAMGFSIPCNDGKPDHVKFREEEEDKQDE